MDEQMQQQLVQLVQDYMQGDQQAIQQIQQIMQVAKSGDQQAIQIAQALQNIMEQMKQSAKFGAKLNYVKYLREICPDGYEMKTFKKGGALCKKCMKKASEGTQFDSPKSDPISEFRCGRKMNQKK